MLNKYNKVFRIIGFVLVFAIAVLNFIMTFAFYQPELLSVLLDVGIDAMGAMVCVALYYGYLMQEGPGVHYFRVLNILVSVAFFNNECMFLTASDPSYSIETFSLAIVSKIIDVGILVFFYKYVKTTLEFKGRFAEIASKLVNILAIPQIILVLSNIFYPVTFYISEEGLYEYGPLAWGEDIYLLVVVVISSILIIRSDSALNLKVAAMMFVVLPVIEYIVTLGEFASAGMYAMVMMALIIVYCVIFNDKSSKLAATQNELNLATDIQTSMLPSIFPAFPNREEFDLYASMDPAKEVGGDFYDFFMIDDDHLALVIADVSGKGVPAALFMMSSKIMIADYALMGGTPAKILERVNKQIIKNNKSNMFVTVWLGILEISTGKLTSANAGHEYPMININGQYELWKDKHGIAIGAIEMAKYKDNEMTLKKGDSIFVYTDGVAEATNANNELFETDRTLDALNELPKESSQKEVLEGVRDAVDTFVDKAPQFDDLTMLGFKYFGAGGEEI